MGDVSTECRAFNHTKPKQKKKKKRSEEGVTNKDEPANKLSSSFWKDDAVEFGDLCGGLSDCCGVQLKKPAHLSHLVAHWCHYTIHPPIPTTTATFPQSRWYTPRYRPPFRARTHAVHTPKGNVSSHPRARPLSEQKWMPSKEENTYN